MTPVDLVCLDRAGLKWAQATVTRDHYLHAPVDARCSVEGYGVLVGGEVMGCLLVGRPEATKVKGWYGSLDDVRTGKCAVSYWSVLNLARVWLDPRVQPGGAWYEPSILPGFRDRHGVWHSTLASTALWLLIARVGVDYLLRRPPCFLDEPYQLTHLLSYQNARLHRGIIYQAAGFERYRDNGKGIVTWRIALPPLTPEQDQTIRQRAMQHPRSIAYRARRAAADVRQPQLALGGL